MSSSAWTSTTFFFASFCSACEQLDDMEIHTTHTHTHTHANLGLVLHVLQSIKHLDKRDVAGLEENGGQLGGRL